MLGDALRDVLDPRLRGGRWPAWRRRWRGVDRNYGDGNIVSDTVEGNSSPGGVDGECATGLVERVARSLLAATRGA